jgi:hypothetical protein
VPDRFVTRREAALRLDIPLEMARRHELPSRMTESEFAALDADPPAWLRQSRENRTGKRPVWVELRCDVCGFTETARPKKWWPAGVIEHGAYLSCDFHGADELPDPPPGMSRTEVDGIGSRFIAMVDAPA